MNSKIALVVALALSAGLIGNAYAHKSEVVGDYKIEVGWKKEPPVAGKSNSIEVMITKASSADKKQDKTKMDHSKMDMGNETKSSSTKMKSIAKNNKKTMHDHKSTDGIPGLSKKLEVDVTLAGKKTFLKLVEDKKMPGRYYGAYIPLKAGSPVVHIFGKIDNIYVEATFHPEKVEGLLPH